MGQTTAGVPSCIHGVQKSERQLKSQRSGTQGSFIWRPAWKGPGEAGGLLGNDDHTIWLNVGMWFDHHLKGIENGIDRAAPFSTKVLNISKAESSLVVHQYKPISDGHLRVKWTPVYVDGEGEVLG